MANVTKGGFRPWGTFSGGQGVVPSTFTREIASGYGTALFRYQPIKSVSDGTIAAAAAGEVILGVAVGYSYVRSGKREPSNTVPASTTFSPTAVGSANASLCHYIWCTPDIIFEADADDGTTVTTLAAAIGLIGNNTDHVVGTGDATTGLSAAAIDISLTSGGTNTAQWRIVDVLKSADNDPTLTRWKLLVTCNEGEHPAYTSTGGA